MYRIWFERTMPAKYAELLEGVAENVGSASEAPDDPLRDLVSADALVAGARFHYDAALLDRFPSLRVISRAGIGLDNVSLPDATERGIVVCYTPMAPTISTAEHALTLMFAVAKRLRWAEAAARSGASPDVHSQHDALELYGLTLGLVGCGQIGSRVARVGRSLDMHVIVFDPYLTEDRAREIGVERIPTLEHLLGQADVVSLHAPLTPETRNLMNAERFAQMKPGAILINTARGPLIDEAALVDALDSGRLRGAGLDVFVVEPPSPDHPLLNRDNVVATPHIASATHAGRDRLWRTAIIQALQALRGERPEFLANPEIWPPRWVE